MKPSIVPPGRTVALSGMMGTGKSTIGPLLAGALGYAFVDLDAHFSSVHGVSIAEFFRREGEPKFREEEARLSRALLADGIPRVLALGGFTVGQTELRHELLARTVLVTLTAPTEVLATRLAGDDTRPLLGAQTNSPVPSVTRIESLLAARAAAYAECHLRVDTDRAPEDVVNEIAKHAAAPRVAVPLGTRSYCVHIAQDPAEAKAALVDAVLALAPSSLIVVSDSNVMRLRRAPLDALLDAVLLPRTLITLAPGEANKTLHSVSPIWDAALGARIDRDALVIAYGGGVVGDLAAFAASTLLRGVRLLQAPTTVLSMLDSSVGGKTGFDHATGKNLIGSFWQPSGVVVDITHTDTLPARELSAGLAEAVKMAITHDAALFAQLEADAERLARGDHNALARVVQRGIAIKAGVVARDEHEHGERALLNLGHTVGHALEVDGGYSRWLHGEAVALGLGYELDALARLGHCPVELPARVRALCMRLNLPTTIPAHELARSFTHMGADKKRRGGALAMAKLSALGQATITRVALRELVDALS